MVNKFSRIFLIVFIIGVIVLVIRGYRANYDIEHNGKILIGSYVSYRKHPKTSSNYFIFYVDGKKYERDAGDIPTGFQFNRGKFYKLIYSEKYDFFRVFFNQEVTDTSKILEAGFNTEDIKRGLRTQKRNKDFIR